ncbi:bifunctional hydroxymethylpyrimidine kinase/phosphomethylpyrimidine kinase [Fictibacillus phosphorivorans]|uniref:bifunctional hydroxymethylpyrimidine kinase/phosphomethylpyrimidine kinase n=1 Tax=Fictibacillus phosphorivorans TaxID=1221500 RepID=UPI00203C3AEA|nr:bifunctional hydroxymethylpyrimidine kinase/phosphomethylpyrimidine kinase [Fictibacillus phosphorivorans]MCM3719274.1 bifunctional hydroxymethylpyrimidine kinase/phosphomethylpyrimidine kinase [Fictibacillus phosphorivorans]MCM3776896.1 bifunctional hydroxymethylpyrimidine kinase/phosphomethylpyrimidine kinase [Fictibacillus phosphorivorans]
MGQLIKVCKALTIAGSDSGGGAGIQADLKTFQEFGVYGMSVLTAVTAQNTQGVQGVYPVPLAGLEQQLISIGSDLKPDAVKTGMLFSGEYIERTAYYIEKFGWNNLVVDPVMVAKGGATLLGNEALEAMKKHMLPLAKVITPNVPEAEALTGMEITNDEAGREAARILLDKGADCVVIKGGHLEEELVTDLVSNGDKIWELVDQRVYTKNTHGTGCTLSAALTAELAYGKTIESAVQNAKNFIQIAIAHGIDVGSGHGPVNHFAYRRILHEQL